MKYLHLYFDGTIRRFEVVNHFGPCIAAYNRVPKEDLEEELGFYAYRMLCHAEAVFVHVNRNALQYIAVYEFLENFDNLKEIDLTEMLFEQP